MKPSSISSKSGKWASRYLQITGDEVHCFTCISFSFFFPRYSPPNIQKLMDLIGVKLAMSIMIFLHSRYLKMRSFCTHGFPCTCFVLCDNHSVLYIFTAIWVRSPVKALQSTHASLSVNSFNIWVDLNFINSLKAQLSGPLLLQTPRGKEETMVLAPFTTWYCSLLWFTVGPLSLPGEKKPPAFLLEAFRFSAFRRRRRIRGEIYWWLFWWFLGLSEKKETNNSQSLLLFSCTSHVVALCLIFFLLFLFPLWGWFDMGVAHRYFFCGKIWRTGPLLHR